MKEEAITNQELLSELSERLKNKKISFQLSVTNNDKEVLDIDTDLKDNESNFRINLQKEED
jgi:mannitol/fructose-specific phosphotransferase system IIA component (Ntr-type)